MELNTRRCMQCKGEMTMTVLDPIAGEDQGVGMRIERMPAMRCPEGHKRFVAPEFAVRMMEAFVAAGPLAPLAAAAEKGLLRTRLHCPGCGAELAAPAAERIEARRAIALKGLEAFDVVQFHVWSDDWVGRGDWLETIEALKKEGKLRFLGVSINDHQPENALRLVESGAVDAVQVIYNAFSQQPESRCHHVLQMPEVEKSDAASNEHIVRTQCIYTETHGDEQRMYACTTLHTLTIEGGLLRMRLKRVNLLNCDAALPSIQLFL